MTDTPVAPAPALPRRLVALVYDLFLVMPLIMAAVFMVMGLRSLLTGEGPGELGDQTLPRALVQAVAWLTAAGFFWSFWLKGGQTLGMQAWRIKLVAADGQAPRFRQVLLRSVGATLSAACLGAGYLWSLVDRQNAYWHDHLSGTRLIMVPPRKKGAKD